MNDHADIYAAETAALEPTSWERWIDCVEDLMGHDADGNLHEDGYSIDSFFDMYEAGFTPEQASTRIIGALFVGPDGRLYRLHRCGRDALTEKYVESYDVLTSSGSQTVRYELPPGATLVWAPDRGITAFGICVRCGRAVTGSWLSTDDWRASAHCVTCLHGAPG